MVTGMSRRESAPRSGKPRRIFGDAQVALWHLQELTRWRRGGGLSGKVDPMAGRIRAEEKWS